MSEPVYERMKTNLEQLRTTNTPETIDNSLEQAPKDKTGVPNILDHILPIEVRSQKLRITNTRTQMAGFPFRKSLDDFYFEFQPSIHKGQIMDLATIRFAHNLENVVLLAFRGIRMPFHSNNNNL